MNRIQQNTFAAACYDMNSIDELRAALNTDPDQQDMAEWGITADQWKSKIKLALTAKLADAE